MGKKIAVLNIVFLVDSIKDNVLSRHELSRMLCYGFILGISKNLLIFRTQFHRYCCSVTSEINAAGTIQVLLQDGRFRNS